MNELSLFTGGGGGIYGSKILGWRTVGYVEADQECQKIIEQRIENGIFDTAPRFGDIRKFISEGFAETFKGMVDVVTAGFPCQPFSVAGKRLAESDTRNMWPSTIECLRIVRPKFALLENVPGLLAHPYFGTILGELAEAGYRYRWACLGADDIGANHRRKRLWILANSIRRGCGPDREQRGLVEIPGRRANISMQIAESSVVEICPECREGIWYTGEFWKCKCGWYGEFQPTAEDLADCDKMWGLQQKGSKQDEWRRVSDGSEKMANAEGTECEWRWRSPRSWRAKSGCGGWWTVEPDVGRVAHGVANGRNRIRMLGNGQVPLCMATAFSILSEGIIG